MDVETTTGKEEVAIVGESVSIDLSPELFMMEIFRQAERVVQRMSINPLPQCSICILMNYLVNLAIDAISYQH